MFVRYVTPLFAAIILALSSLAAEAVTFRSGMDALVLSANDDDSSSEIELGFQIDFFGIDQDKVFVNNNGNVTFGSGMRNYTSGPLSDIDRPVIAPFFADVDTANGLGNEVTYGQGHVYGRKAFAVNWFDVNYYNNYMYPNQLNSFQLVIIDRSDTGAGNFDVEFNYDKIRWEAGTGSGGDGWGLGGESARAGFSAGTEVAGSYIELAGSGVSGSFIDGGSHALATNSNIGIAGRYVFNVRDSVIFDGHAVPLPASLPMLCIGLGLLAARGRKSTRNA